jgi:hypothetical protein
MDAREPARRTPGGARPRAPPAEQDARRGARVVGARSPLDVDDGVAALASHHAVQLGGRIRRAARGDGPAHRHEVGDRYARVTRVERGDEHVGIRVIPLRARARPPRCDTEAPAAAGVQQRAEHARAVEVRQAAPVDAAVGADQRRGQAVADDAVVGDREVPVVYRAARHPAAAPAPVPRAARRCSSVSNVHLPGVEWSDAPAGARGAEGRCKNRPE